LSIIIFCTPCPSDPCTPEICSGTDQTCIPDPSFGCVDNSGGCAVNACIDGQCVFSCAYDACCDDGNRCTNDQCLLGACYHSNITYCFCEDITNCADCFNITLNDPAQTKCAWNPFLGTCGNLTALNISGCIYNLATNILTTVTSDPTKLYNPKFNRYLFNNTFSCNYTVDQSKGINSFDDFCNAYPGKCSKTADGKWIFCDQDYAGCLALVKASGNSAALIGGLVGGLGGALCALLLLLLALALRYKEKILPSAAPGTHADAAAGSTQDNPLYCQTGQFNNAVYQG